MTLRRAALLAGLAACLLAPPGAMAQQAVAGLAAPIPAQPAVDPQWASSFAAFAQADAAQAPPPGGVLFVGSSSIRLWNNLETQFKALPVLKRGFGGSRMIDCARYLSRLVVPYKPRMVLVYAGDNDLAEGRAPREILDSFVQFVDGVRRALPDTRIAYISIKPSPARQTLIDAARETNALIRQYAAGAGKVDYIDIFTPMLAADGRPRPELFRDDALHLNDAGYALWTSVISTYVR